MAFLAGAFLYRWRGGGFFPNGPRPLSQSLFDLPMLVVPIAIMGWSYWLVPAYFLAVAFECTGHGGFMDLGRWKSARKPERLEFLIQLANGKISEYWYDALGMAVTGLAVTIWPGAVLGFSGYAGAGVLLALSGPLKAVGYMLTAKMPGEPTEWGEALSGGLRWAACAGIWALIK